MTRPTGGVWSECGRRERSGLTDSPTPTGGTPKSMYQKKNLDFIVIGHELLILCSFYLPLRSFFVKRIG